MTVVIIGSIIVALILALFIFFISGDIKWREDNRIYVEEHCNKFKIGSKIIYLGIEMEVTRNKYIYGGCMINALEAMYVDKNKVIREVSINNYNGVVFKQDDLH